MRRPSLSILHEIALDIFCRGVYREGKDNNSSRRVKNFTKYLQGVWLETIVISIDGDYPGFNRR